VRLNDALSSYWYDVGGQAGVKLAMGWDAYQPGHDITAHSSKSLPVAATACLGSMIGHGVGHRYGTLLVDLERHQSNCCQTGSLTLTSWLRTIQAEIVTRDRSKLTKRHSQGNTDSIRWQIGFICCKTWLKHLAQAFAPHSQLLKTVGATQSLSSVTSPESTAVAQVLPPQPMPKSNALPNSVGRGEKRTTNKSGNCTTKAGWLQQLLVKWYWHDSISVTYAPPPSRNAKDAVIVVGAAYLTLTKTMFFNVGTMVVMTPCGCLGDQSAVLQRRTLSLAIPSLSSSPRNATEKRRRSIKQLPK